MATIEELQPAIDQSLSRHGAVASERIEGGVRYTTPDGTLIGVVDDSPEVKEAESRTALDANRQLKAIVLWALEIRLGRPPTAQEARAARDRIAAIYKDL